MDLSNLPLREISSVAILVPLGLAAFQMKTGDKKFRLFFLFLLFGAVVDNVGWFVNGTGADLLPYAVFQYSYLFFEALFFVWLCTEFLAFGKAKKLRIGLYLILSIAFLLKGWILYSNRENPYTASGFNSLLDGIFLISISFLSAFALLHMAEKRDDLISFSWFWIVSGIFFYCFGSFFIDLIVNTGLVAKVWGLRNFVNIIQYGFFIVGIFKYKPLAKSSSI